MNKETPFICSMPMNGSGRSPNDIPYGDPNRLLSLILYPARTSCNSQKLAALMLVPVGSRTGLKDDACYCNVGMLKNSVLKNLASEGTQELSRY